MRTRQTRVLAALATLLVPLSACSASGAAGAGAAGGQATGSHAAPTPRSTASSAVPATSRPATTRPPAARVVSALAEWRLPAPLSRLVAAPTGGSTVLLLGGLLPGDITVGTVYRVDVATGHVASAGTLPDPVHDAAIAVLGGTPTVFGGGAASEVAAVQQVSPTGGARVVGRLPQPRSDVSAASLNGRAYLVGGYDGSTELPGVLATADGRTFRTVGRLALPVRYAAVVAAAGAVWVLGGEHDGVPITTVQRIDPRTGAVRVAGHLPQPLGEAVAVTVGGETLLAGGRGAAGPSAAVWRFDPARVRFTPVATLPVPVAMPGVAYADGKAWLFGGESTTGHTRAVQNLALRP